MELKDARSEIIIGQGPNVGQRVLTPQGEMVIWYSPASAEAFAQSMHDAATMVLAREGLEGEAHRDINVGLPTINIGLKVSSI